MSFPEMLLALYAAARRVASLLFFLSLLFFQFSKLSVMVGGTRQHNTR